MHDDSFEPMNFTDEDAQALQRVNEESFVEEMIIILEEANGIVPLPEGKTIVELSKLDAISLGDYVASLVKNNHYWDTITGADLLKARIRMTVNLHY